MKLDSGVMDVLRAKEAELSAMAQTRNELARRADELEGENGKLRYALQAIIDAEKAYDLRKYDCPSAQLLWAIEEAEEVLK